MWRGRFIAVVGVAAAAARIAWVFSTHRVLTPIDGALLVACALAIAATLVPHPGSRGVAFGAAGLLALLGLGWGAPTVSFPAIDMARPWGMDWEPYPITRPPVLVATLYLLLPGAAARGAWRRRLVLRASFFLAAVGLVAWWCVPRWFEMDLVTADEVIPDLPAFLPQPGHLGAGDTPVVLDGHLEHLNWTEYAYQSPPITALGLTVRREWALGEIAHGISVELAPGSGLQEGVRAPAWHLRNALTATWICAHAMTAALMAVTAVWFVNGGRLLTRPRTVLLQLLATVLALPAAANLSLLALVLATGLGEARAEGVPLALTSAGVGVAVALLRQGGRALAEWVDQPAGTSACGSSPSPNR